jgi:hypothetical protein
MRSLAQRILEYNREQRGQLIASFGGAALVRGLNGRYEVRGDPLTAEWCRLFGFDRGLRGEGGGLLVDGVGGGLDPEVGAVSRLRRVAMASRLGWRGVAVCGQIS